MEKGGEEAEEEAEKEEEEEEKEEEQEKEGGRGRRAGEGGRGSALRGVVLAVACLVLVSCSLGVGAPLLVFRA